MFNCVFRTRQGVKRKSVRKIKRDKKKKKTVEKSGGDSLRNISLNLRNYFN